MSVIGGRFGHITIVLISVMLATLVGGGYYYFQVKSNEDYQNALHFRELNIISRSIDSGIDQLFNVGEKLNEQVNLTKVEQFSEYLTKIHADIEQQLTFANHTRKRLSQALEREQQLLSNGNSGSMEERLIRTEFRDTVQATKENETQIAQVRASIDEVEQSLVNKSMQVRRFVESHSEPFKFWFEQHCLTANIKDHNLFCKSVHRAYLRLGHMKQHFNGLTSLDDIEVRLIKLREEQSFANPMVITELNQQIAQQRQDLAELDQVLQGLTKLRRSYERHKTLDDLPQCKQHSITPSEGYQLCQNILNEVKRFNRQMEQHNILQRVINRDPNSKINDDDSQLSPRSMLPESMKQQAVTKSGNRLADNYQLAVNHYQQLSDFIQNQHAVVSDQATLIEQLTKEYQQEEPQYRRQVLRFVEQQQVLAESLKIRRQLQQVLSGLRMKVVALQSEKNNALRDNRRVLTTLEQDIERSKVELDRIYGDIKMQLRQLTSQFESLNIATEVMTSGIGQFNSEWSQLIDCYREGQQHSEQAKSCQSDFDLVDTALTNFLNKDEVMRQSRHRKSSAFENIRSLSLTGSMLKQLDALDLNKLNEEDRALFHERELTITEPLSGMSGEGMQLVLNAKSSDQIYLYHARLRNFLGPVSDYYPLVLMVNDKGRQIERQDNVAKGSETFGLTFEQLQPLLSRLFKQHKALEDPPAADGSSQVDNFNYSRQLAGPGFSGFIDVQIAGVDYRIFVSPYSNSRLSQVEMAQDGHGKTVLKEQYYLLGFKAKSDFDSQIFTVSSSTITILIIVVLAISALLPVLKLSLVSVNRAFLPSERWALFIGMAIFVASISIMVTDGMIYGQLKSNLSRQSERILAQMSQSFQNEVGLLNRYAQEQKYHPNQQPLHIEAQTNVNLPFGPTNLESMASYFLESLFFINHEGFLSGQARWSSDRLNRTRDIDVSQRQYYKQNIQCDRRVDSGCDDIRMQRIFNLRDGRTTTQFASYYQYHDRDGGLQDSVLSYGAKLQSLFQPVLPNHFGWLIFENITGDVLYHSEESRSLIENVFVETDNNPQLHALVSQFQLQQFAGNSINPNLTLNYKGQPHHFTLTSLKPIMPWTMVVFYDSKLVKQLNLVLVFMAIVPIALILLLCYLLLRWFANRDMLRRLYWYDHHCHSAYRPITGKLLIYSLVVYLALGYIVWFDLASIVWILTAIFVMAVIAWAFYDINRYLSRARDVAVAKEIAQLKAVKTKSIDDKAEQIKQQQVLGEEQARRKSGRRWFSGYLLIQLIAFIAIPCAAVTTLSGKFLLQKYADSDINHIVESRTQAQIKRGEYLSLLRTDVDGKTRVDLAKHAANVHCYLGNIDEQTQNVRSYRQECQQVKSWYGDLAPKSYLTPDGLYPWFYQYIDTSLLFASQLWALNKLEVSLSKTVHAVGVKFEFAEFFSSALMHQSYWLLIALLVGLFVYVLICEVICVRLMGMNVATNFRLNDGIGFKPSSNKVSMLHSYLSNAEKASYVQVIRPSEHFVKRLFKLESINITTNVPVQIDELVEYDESLEVLCRDHLKIEDNQQFTTVVFTGLELVALERDNRIRALNILEHLISLGHVHVVLLVEVAPLYRLSRQCAYPNNEDGGQKANASEVTRWARLMKNFAKLYNWTPETKHFLADPEDPILTLEHEAKGWPELKQIEHQFYSYHFTMKHFEEDWRTLDKGKQREFIETHKESIKDYWLADQVVEFFNSNASALYRYRWELCTKNERVLLIQMANGASPNPQDPQPLEHLMRRSYIYRDNGWHIVNESFRKFILSAEEPHVVEQWMEEAADSPWRYWQIPILTMLLVIFGLVAYSATEELNSLLAMFTGLLGVIPMLYRSFTGFGGDQQEDNGN